MLQLHFRKLIWGLWVLLLLYAGWLALSPDLSWAHAEYKRSEPAAGAVIPESPPEVQIWFTQELFRRQGANTLSVFGPDGTQVDLGDARIDDDDRTHMIVSLPPNLPSGHYTVRWQNLSAEDGDTAEGEFSFTVDPAAPAAEVNPQPTPTATTAPIATPTPAPPPPTPTTLPTSPPEPKGAGLPCLSGTVFVALGGIWAGVRRREGRGYR